MTMMMMMLLIIIIIIITIIIYLNYAAGQSCWRYLYVIGCQLTAQLERRLMPPV